MLKKVINPILYLPLALFANTLEALPNEKQNVIDKVLEEEGITIVPKDHPIYKMGPSITFVRKTNKINKKKRSSY